MPSQAEMTGAESTKVAGGTKPRGGQRSTAGEHSLEARQVTVRFEGVCALDSIDLQLTSGEILGLIGPNGAGKTTLVNVLTGFQTPDAGTVWIDARDVTRLPAHKRVPLGVCRSFQSTRLFGGLSVVENVELGGLGLGLGRREARVQAEELLASFALSHAAGTLAAALPHGEQRRIGILRALAARPKFLLLDEPAAGLDERETNDLMAFITEMRDARGCGVIVIEHDMHVIMGLCERVHVLDFGKTIAEGSCREVRSNPVVIAAYLGEEESV
jgi:branched-chain amino acid transport system ATP-binding protein